MVGSKLKFQFLYFTGVWFPSFSSSLIHTENAKTLLRHVQESSNAFQIRTMYVAVCRFQAATVKEVIHGVMNDELGGKKYTVEEAEVWTKNIATSVRNKVKGKR